MPKQFRSLPLAGHHDSIIKWTKEHQNLLLTAPTGTGKSTYLPWMLSNLDSDNMQKVAVLQPRRIAALGLARYLAQCLGEDVGQTVGYQFRFESIQSTRTKILFETYGSFVQQVLYQSRIDEWDWIIFDEFHERKSEMDLLLALILAVQKNSTTKTPRLAVLSAEMNREQLETLMGIQCLRIEDPGFAVQIINQEPKANEALDSQVLRAVRTLESNQLKSTTLVFLPGKAEIDTCYHCLDRHYRLMADGPQILPLHGSLSMSEQQRVFENTLHWRIILSTNIAETSLTIPNVTAVIDSGLERSTDFDHQRKVQQLRLGKISLQNALQRKGRAGRTQKGHCIRLWSLREESLFAKESVAEILRMDLSTPILKRSALASRFGLKLDQCQWITAPDSKKLDSIYSKLSTRNLIGQDWSITELGSQVLNTPVADLDLALFLNQQVRLNFMILAAVTLIDSAIHQGNLLSLADDLVHKPQTFSKDIRLQYERLQTWNKKPRQEFHSDQLQKAFLKGFSDRLAIPSESGKAYRIGDELTILLDPSQTGNAQAIIAFSLLQSSGGKNQQISQCLFIPISQSVLEENQDLQLKYDVIWKASQDRFVGLEIRTQNDLEIGRREVSPQEASPDVRARLADLVGSAWIEKSNREGLEHLWMDDKNHTLLAKMLWATQLFPEHGLPQWTAEDHELILTEFTSGVFLQKDLNADRYRQILEDYFGRSMLSWLHKTFPDTTPLPSGKMGRYNYPKPNEGPVEISGRIGDFMGMQGEHWIAEKRLKVRYDLLAPNYRTAQKTWDLSGFWKGSYLEIRKELRGRYPRHPWPENP